VRPRETIVRDTLLTMRPGLSGYDNNNNDDDDTQRPAHTRIDHVIVVVTRTKKKKKYGTTPVRALFLWRRRLPTVADYLRFLGVVTAGPLP
jgi:hypothetical protein